MTEDLVSVLPDDRVERVRDIMLSFGIHAVLVMEGNDVLGIVTSTDLIDDWPEEEQVTTVMTPTPASISDQSSIREAAEIMLRLRTHHLLVSDEREVVGIVSSLDLLEVLTVPAT